MKNIDIIKFEKIINNRNLNNISNIGEELHFQRELYNHLNSTKKFVIKSENENTSFNLGKELAKCIENLTGKEIPVNDKGMPVGFSDEVLNNIEKNNINNGRKPVYSLDIYYDKIYYMFKLYGFIKEDYDIINLLNKYGIKPSNDNKQNQMNEIIKDCNSKYTNNIAFNLQSCSIFALSNDINYLLENDSIYTFLYDKEKYKLLLTITDKPFTVIQFEELKKIMKSKFATLSNIEKKCLSLYMEQSSSFIDDILNHKIKYITLHTLERICDYLDLKDTDIYYIMKKRKENNLKFNIREIAIYKFPKLKYFE
ncbi:MAG: helix-turn-helix transcriptional regulator [Bacilli bacterium]|nr:helix-turn-helix transcriptional regulator [Bacilli bacterium]